jgi:hypothetical protein
MATYAKLRSGNWGVRVEGEVTPGQVVTVTKKDGSTRTETIDRVVWSGNGVSLCTIKPTTRSGGGYGRGGRYGDGGPRGHQPCYMCGSYYCEGARGGLCDDD